MPQAGVLALLLLSVSVGFIHGALDAVLLPQRFISRAQAALMFVAYLLLVLLLGWVLSTAISLALWVLLLMSAWHFMAWGWLALVAAWLLLGAAMWWFFDAISIGAARAYTHWSRGLKST